MAQTIRLKVVTPAGSVIDKDVLSVTACSDVGEFCVLPEHCPILASLAAGRFLVETANDTQDTYVIDRGFFEGGIDHANVITQYCVSASDIDSEAVKAEIDQLKEQLASLPSDDPSAAELNSALLWAGARFDNAKK